MLIHTSSIPFYSSPCLSDDRYCLLHCVRSIDNPVHYPEHGHWCLVLSHIRLLLCETVTHPGLGYGSAHKYNVLNQYRSQRIDKPSQWRSTWGNLQIGEPNVVVSDYKSDSIRSVRVASSNCSCCCTIRWTGHIIYLLASLYSRKNQTAQIVISISDKISGEGYADTERR